LPAVAAAPQTIAEQKAFLSAVDLPLSAPSASPYPAPASGHEQGSDDLFSYFSEEASGDPFGSVSLAPPAVAFRTETSSFQSRAGRATAPQPNVAQPDVVAAASTLAPVAVQAFRAHESAGGDTFSYFSEDTSADAFGGSPVTAPTLPAEITPAVCLLPHSFDALVVSTPLPIEPLPHHSGVQNEISSSMDLNEINHSSIPRGQGRKLNFLLFFFL
jgi:hypothetical protein